MTNQRPQRPSLPAPERPRAATLTQGRQGPPPWWRQHLWRHAPAVLLQHTSAFIALSLAGFLVTLAAASAPFVTTASASSALKEKLAALSPLTTGLQISGEASGGTATQTLLRNDDRRRKAVADLQRALGLQPAVFTLESNTPLIVNSPRGSAQVLLMARTGALAHTTRLRSVPGAGVWIADLTARSLGFEPGGSLPLEYGERGGPTHIARLRIKGIYRALDSSAPSPYWANFLTEILPRGVDPPPPARYVLMSRAQILALAHRLGGGRVVNYEGQVFRLGTGFSLVTKAELAVDPYGLTLARARRLDHRFAAVRSSLAGSALAQRLGCAVPPSVASRSVVGASRSTCHVSSSLSSAVALADSSAASISPAVSLLSDAAAVIALAVAAAAGLFLVRRRRSETALMFARGESTPAFAGRTGLEMLLPVLLGGALGFGIAVAFAGAFAPSGSTDSATLGSALGHGGTALAAALAVAVVVACAAFARQFDSGRRIPRWLRLLPWELPLLAVGLWLLVDVSTGGGLVTNARTGTSHPTLAVFVAPLLLAAAAAGAVSRGVRAVLRRSTGRAAGRSTVPFLVVRRLAAARGTLVVLAVVSATAFAAYFYAAAVAGSLSRGVDEKAYVAYGGDVQGVVSDNATIPPDLQFPAARVDFANQVATLGSAIGPYADVLAVDSRKVGSIIHWDGSWGRDPRPELARLGTSSPGHVLPVVVAGAASHDLRAIWLQGVRVPVTVVRSVGTFPGMTIGTPLVVVDRQAVAAVARARHVYDALGTPQTLVWAKGPPAAVSRALGAPPLEADFLSTVDQFRMDPDVVLAKRTFSYMRLIALAAGLLVLVALVLYLQARQRTQAIASVLASRMGLSRRAEIAALALELGAIALFAALIGGTVAIVAAVPIVGHIDPLAVDPPTPALTVPLAAIAASAAALVVVAVAAGALVSFTARRTDLSEALRVA